MVFELFGKRTSTVDPLASLRGAKVEGVYFYASVYWGFMVYVLGACYFGFYKIILI